MIFSTMPDTSRVDASNQCTAKPESVETQRSHESKLHILMSHLNIVHTSANVPLNQDNRCMIMFFPNEHASHSILPKLFLLAWIDMQSLTFEMRRCVH